MPFYEYQCQACGVQTEVLQKITDAPLRKCPDCGKSRLVKLVSAPVFRLKGGGWYETDFKSDKEARRNLAGAEKDAAAAGGEAKADAPKADAADKPAAPATGEPSKAKSESKPAAKPVAKPRARSKPTVRKTGRRK